MYGSKTDMYAEHSTIKFESSVILYGSKTNFVKVISSPVFESGVILYGSKKADSLDE